MKCEHCGREIGEGMLYCPSCGAEARKSQAPRPDPWEVQPDAYRQPSQSGGYYHTAEGSRPPETPPPAAEAPAVRVASSGQSPSGGHTYRYDYQGAPAGSTQQAGSRNSLATVSLILGILSLFLNLFGILGVAAVVCSLVSMSQMRKEGQTRGKGLAIAGLVMGIISVIYGVITVVMLFGALAAPRPRFY